MGNRVLWLSVDHNVIRALVSPQYVDDTQVCNFFSLAPVITSARFPKTFGKNKDMDESQLTKVSPG